MNKKHVALLSGFFCLTAAMEAQTEIRISMTTTRRVESGQGGRSNARSNLNTKFSLVQDATRNSNLGINWTRPGHFTTSQNENNQTARTQLSRLVSGSQFADVRSERDRRRADLSQVWCDWTNGSTSGMGQQPGWATVCRRQIFSDNSRSGRGIVHTHEIGHNLNATHGRGFCVGGSVNRRTIMDTTNSSCSRSFIDFFSSSSRSTRGQRLGNGSNNNRERIRSRRGAASRQR